MEIDALVAVWLGMDIDALIAIYSAAFPVLNRYEDITWFDANGWKIAGYHRTFGQIQKKGDYEEMLAYVESGGGTTKVPDGYTPRHRGRRHDASRPSPTVPCPALP